jgi:hypothetical protein
MSCVLYAWHSIVCTDAGSERLINTVMFIHVCSCRRMSYYMQDIVLCIHKYCVYYMHNIVLRVLMRARWPSKAELLRSVAAHVEEQTHSRGRRVHFEVT